MLASHGSVVSTDSSAVTASSTSGRPPRPKARNVSASTQTVTPAWTMTASQKSGCASAVMNRP